MREGSRPGWCWPAPGGESWHQRPGYLRWPEWINRVMQGWQVSNSIGGAGRFHMTFGAHGRPVCRRGAGLTDGRAGQVTTNKTDRP